MAHVEVTCTAKGKPKSYDARLEPGRTFMCARCGALVLAKGDDKHKVRKV